MVSASASASLSLPPHDSLNFTQEKALFIERFGSLSEFDDPSLNNVIARIKNRLEISTALGITNDHIDTSWAFSTPSVDHDSKWQKIQEKLSSSVKFFMFDADGKAIFVDQPFAGLSFFQSLKLKYQYYRGEIREKTIKQIETIYKQHSGIVDEFEERLKTSKCPLQDLRDFGTRLQVMDQERINLELGFKSSTYAHTHFLNNLSCLAKCIFKIIAFFHAFFHPIQNKELSSIEQPQSFKSFNTPVQLGEVTLNNVSYLICAQLTSSNRGFTGEIALTILNPQNNTAAKMTIQRTLDGCNAHCSENFKGRQLLVNRLFDYVGRDSQTGDYPMRRLLAQIAVEILQREDETRLSITMNHEDRHVFAPGGFSDFFGNAEILQEVAQARAKGMLFPEYRNLRGSTVSIFKSSEMDEKFQTFYRIWDVNTGSYLPTLVDFELGATPIAWEAQIKRQPLLTLYPGPVFPRYIHKDLSRHEVQKGQRMDNMN